MRKRAVSLALCLCMVLSLLPLPVLATGKHPFTDVAATDWFNDSVEFVYEHNLMKGTSDTTFAPYRTTQRGMIVTILHRLEGTPTATSANPFTDVPRGSNYENAIIWASANGIVNGYDNATFGPYDNLTRQQIATILYRYAQIKGYRISTSVNLSEYADFSQIGDYARTAMAWANGEGLINGNSSKQLMPTGNATRAQAAAILTRFCQNIVPEQTPPVSPPIEGPPQPTPEPAEPTSYAVTFDLNYSGGGIYQTLSVKAGEKITAPTKPTRDNYSFMGWYTSSTGGSKFNFNKVINAITTLYAHWSKLSSGGGGGGGGSYTPPVVTPTYSVTFDSNAGSYVNTQTISSGNRATKPTDPTKEGYSFGGWYSDSGLTNLYDFSSPVTRSLTLYAKWNNTSDAEPSDDDDDGLADIIEMQFGTSTEVDDTDNDGLTDYTEIFETDTDPLIVDTDGNGTPDADEDHDGDGLTNIEEQTLGTKSNATDTDGDGLTDFEEVKEHHTNPLNSDSDNDTLTDDEEILLGLDPMNPMTDGVTPDAERTFEQTTDESVLDDGLASSDNWLRPSISGNVSGLISNNVRMYESPIYAFESNRSVVSDMLAIETTYENPVTLSFAYGDEYIGDMDNLSIVTYGSDGLEIIDTRIDTENHVIVGDITEDGAYFVLDLDEFLKGLGIDVFNNLDAAAYGEASTFAVPNVGAEVDMYTHTDEETQTSNVEGFDADVSAITDSTVSDYQGESDIQEADIDSNIKLDALYDNAGNIIGYEAPDNSSFEASNHIASLMAPSDVTGKADVVFVIDTTGSMRNAITAVKNNVTSFSQALVNNYNIDANFALIEYRDIEADGVGSTVKHRNVFSNWFTNVNAFINEVNTLTVGGGGDIPETPIDALEVARRNDWRADATKLVILVTDVSYKVANSYGISSMTEMANRFKNDEIIVSAITRSSNTYSELTEATDGLYGYIGGSFNEILLQLAEKVGEKTNTGGEWVFLDDFQAVKLKDTLENAASTDSDEDGLMDVEELGTSKEVNMITYILRLLNKHEIPVEYYKGKRNLTVWQYKSNPTLLDTDFDGIPDGPQDYDYDGNPESKVTPDAFPKSSFGFLSSGSSSYFSGNTHANDYDFNINFTVDYTLFFKNLSVYRRALSKLGIIYSLGAYHDTINVTSGTSVSGDDMTLMEAFGLKDVASIKLADEYTDDDLSEISIGHRMVTYQGVTREIVVVPVRGTDGTIEEWSSNFDVGADTDDYWDRNNRDWNNKKNHKGFEVAAYRLYTRICNYLNNLDSDIPKVLYFTGHSRGAAIANILAAKFIDDGYLATSYSFATPNTTLVEKEKAESYTSLFSIVNGDDIVPCLPLDKWGYKKYGKVSTVSIKDNYEDKLGKYDDGTWEALFGTDYNANGNLNDTLKAFSKIANNRDELYQFTGENNTIYSYPEYYDERGIPVGYASNAEAERAATEKTQKHGNRISKLCKYSVSEQKHLILPPEYFVQVEQSPAAFMMILTDRIADKQHIRNEKDEDVIEKYSMRGVEESTLFGQPLGFHIASKYTKARNEFIWTGFDSVSIDTKKGSKIKVGLALRIGGMVHTHMPGSYYLLANDSKGLLP